MRWPDRQQYRPHAFVQRPFGAGKIRCNDWRMTRNFERRYDSKAGGPAADDNANVVLTKLSTRNCVSTDSHRLGQGRVFRCKTIR
jgi:hypothetical protein